MKILSARKKTTAATIERTAITADPGRPILFSKDVLAYFRTNVGRFPAETGGMLGCTEDPNMIDLAAFDRSSRNSSGSFYYDPKAMNDIYWSWKDNGHISALGFFHSHPAGFVRPSYHDISTSLILMRFFHSDIFYMPIFMSNPRNGFYRMYFYTVRMTEKSLAVTLEYILEATCNGYTQSAVKSWSKVYSLSEVEAYVRRTNPQPEKKAAAAISASPAASVAAAVAPAASPAPARIPSKRELFAKVDRMIPENVRNKVIVCVGTGGARSFLENMARHGFGSFILIDRDTVSASNIATQGVYVSEIGRKKTEVLKERILDINPYADVVSVDAFLDDDMSDEDFAGLLRKFPRRKATDYLILGCTDNFYAQKRSSYLALKFGIPYLAAMVYERGAGCELIFVYPGVTSSCPRCLLRNRFEAYENGYKNDVGSEDCSVFVTERMNSLKGQLALMMLCYHDAPGSPYNNLLERVADRNFAMIRTDPDIGRSPLKIGCFDNMLESVSRYTFMDETMWFRQTPDHDCRLCGCAGDLRKLRGRWPDTRALDRSAANAPDAGKEAS